MDWQPELLGRRDEDSAARRTVQLGHDEPGHAGALAEHFDLSKRVLTSCGVKQATATGEDVLIVDTAGRLQNKAHLMDELAKIRRVLGRLNPEAPHDVLLVLDATTGQNALAQVEVFRETAGVTGLIMTKLDGTARGGILVAAAEKFGLPIHAIGVGETADDLRPVDPRAVARAIAGLPPE